jgi:hypothetical protein
MFVKAFSSSFSAISGILILFCMDAEAESSRAKSAEIQSQTGTEARAKTL